ncbi:hypothetical protein FISHEDRAFT_73415 [Fistulina hepatica ATCC 64428]|uniref:BTB domain-containing protein n=1 Tax=Fistulina hepatica ATCC 64428 TaxID=1128425 RepID=A0A0D7ACF1_9AGAR|nr:hypothetical protein FISHEDRAFT_73415 [Fistulina hepatica ATCC 64428]
MSGVRDLRSRKRPRVDDLDDQPEPVSVPDLSFSADSDVRIKPENVQNAATQLLNTPRSAEFWYNDGSLILRAEDMLYRIHRSLLAAQSSIFDELQQMLDVEIEGCPVIQVSDVADNWGQFLAAIYDPRYFSKLKKDDTSALSNIVAILAIAKEYRAKSIWDEAIAHMEKIMPTTLDEYSKRACLASDDVIRNISSLDGLGLLTFLPYALYVGATYHEAEIYDFDASVLSWNWKALILRGRATILRTQKETTFRWRLGKDVVPDDSHDSNCSRRRLTALREQAQIPLRLDFDTVVSFHLCSSLIRDADVCESYKKMLKKVHMKGLQEMWASLPKCFGLGTWAGLHQKQAELMKIFEPSEEVNNESGGIDNTAAQDFDLSA